jgi:putative oxidoreductase
MYGRTGETPPQTLEHHAAQLAVAWGELLGGIALLFGFLTRIAAAGLLIIQVGAIYTVTWARGFSFDAGGGYEYNLALLAMCLTLMLSGGGALSLDRLLWRRRDRKPAEQQPALASA